MPMINTTGNRGGGRTRRKHRTKLATILYVGVQLWVLRRRRWSNLLGVPVGITLLVWVVFDKLLLLPLPHGTLFGG